MSHGPCAAACAEPVVAAAPMSAPRMTATAAPSLASLARRVEPASRTPALRTPAVSAVRGMTSPRGAASDRCSAPSPRLVHALVFMRSPCSTLSTTHQLLALTFRTDRNALPRQDGPRCFGMQTVPDTWLPVKQGRLHDQRHCVGRLKIHHASAHGMTRRRAVSAATMRSGMSDEMLAQTTSSDIDQFRTSGGRGELARPAHRSGGKKVS